MVSSYREAELPLEAIWTDIDHLDGWRDFTFNPVHFPLPEMQVGRVAGSMASRVGR